MWPAKLVTKVLNLVISLTSAFAPASIAERGDATTAVFAVHYCAMVAYRLDAS
jgi:hypothetical protein